MCRALHDRPRCALHTAEAMLVPLCVQSSRTKHWTWPFPAWTASLLRLRPGVSSLKLLQMSQPRVKTRDTVATDGHLRADSLASGGRDMRVRASSWLSSRASQ